MKLSQRYNQVMLITSLLVLIISGIIYYVVIHFILTEKLNKDLRIEENEIIEYVKKYNKLPLPSDFQDQIVSYREIKSEGFQPYFRDTVYRGKHNTKEPGRALVSSLNIRNKTYEVSILKSKVESEDLVQIIFVVTLIILALLIITILLSNRFLLSKLWTPFHVLLVQLKRFNVADSTEIKPLYSEINEFKELNEAALTLTARVKKDYRELKNFTDNASHEMMTPLAVINSKLDTFLQSGTFDNMQATLLDDIYQAIGRLTRLNQTLMLLAKMDNNLIADKSTLFLDILLIDKIKQFQELIEASSFTLSYTLEKKEINAGRHLIDILLNNLISNAIRHNTSGGVVIIELKDKELIISNSSKTNVPLDPKIIFERFRKGSESDGTGLGLALSKQICEYYSYSLHYQFDGLHRFVVKLN